LSSTTQFRSHFLYLRTRVCLTKVIGEDYGMATEAPISSAEAKRCLTAGFCEEVAFRGYFQKQFETMTRSSTAGVILQGILFGISHGYQGLRAIIMIILFGFLYGILALWRKSLRPGMVLHAWSDIYAGYLFQFLRL